VFQICLFERGEAEAGSAAHDSHDVTRVEGVPEILQVRDEPAEAAVLAHVDVAVVLFGNAGQQLAFGQGSVDVDVQIVAFHPNEDVDPFVQRYVRHGDEFFDLFERVHHDDKSVARFVNVETRGIVRRVQPSAVDRNVVVVTLAKNVFVLTGVSGAVVQA